MNTRSIPHRASSPTINLHAHSHPVAFAGSRNGTVAESIATAVVEGFHQRGFGFLTGCAPGIDRCFRSAFIANTAVAQRSIIACAFEDRAQRFSVGEVFASVVVPSGLSPAAALHRRTVWMISHCSILVLFTQSPPTGRWGRGSRLAFDTARFHLKPVFLVTSRPPKPSVCESIFASSLFNVLDGYWVIPAGGIDDTE